MSRRRFSERDVIATLVYQGVTIPCYRCKEPLGIYSDGLSAEREHLHELALGGEDTPLNCRYSHKICHGVITNGTKATTAGSSKQRIAKVARILAGGRKRKGPPIKSRGFQKPIGKPRRMGQRYESNVKDVNA